ncbi:MAG: hypothetical protein KF845_06970 [Cyclobacteriaceae bacterium]|nr:hypothetical protein [Cyclobacteriaceae bacterium]
MKQLGILAFILHYLIALVSLLAFFSVLFSFDVPVLQKTEIITQTKTRLLVDSAIFLALGLSTHWSVFRADRRVQKLFVLLSAVVLILYALNYISTLSPTGQ